MKKIGILSLIVFLGITIWFLFVKSYDYLATFETKTTVGTINQSLKSWSRSIDKNSEVYSKGLNDLNHTLTFNDSVFIYDWEMIAINDSVSKVRVYVKNNASGISNKIKGLFLNTDF